MWRIGILRIVLLSTYMMGLFLGGCDTPGSPGVSQRDTTAYTQQIQRDRDAAWHAELNASMAQASATPATSTAASPESGAPATMSNRQLHNIAGWSLYCTTDRLYDRHGCLGIKDYLHIGWYKPGMAYVTIGKDRERHPRKAMVLRVDTGSPISTHYKGWSDAEATQIMTRLLEGQQVFTRHTTWPADRLVEQDTSLEGIREVWNYMQAWVKESERQ